MTDINRRYSIQKNFKTCKGGIEVCVKNPVTGSVLVKYHNKRLLVMNPILFSEIRHDETVRALPGCVHLRSPQKSRRHGVSMEVSVRLRQLDPIVS